MIGRRILLLSPLAFAGVAGYGAWTVLQRMKEGQFDPHEVPSQLIGKRLPNFAALPPVSDGQKGFGSADVLDAGHPILVNFFASWCVPCLIEAPTLMTLSKEKVQIWGIAYKDQPDAALRYLASNGDPYTRLAMDLPGRVAIDWGVYGVPESYLIDRTGVVRWRQVGPVTPEVVASELRPLLRSVA